MKSGSALAVGVSVSSFSGCLSGPPGLGSPGGGVGSFTSWLPAPGEIRDLDHYRFRTFQPKQMANFEGFANSDDYDTIANAYGRQFSSQMGIGFDEINQLTSTGTGEIAVTDVSREDIVDELEDNNYNDESEHEGYVVYLSPNGANAVGVTDGTVIFGREYPSVPDAVEVVEGIIDTNAGNEDRYEDESDDCRTLLNQLGSGHWVSGQTQEEGSATEPASGRFRDLVARGITVSFDDEKSEYRNVLVFEDADDIDTNDVEDYVDANEQSGRKFDNANDVSTNTDGRSVIVTATLDTDDTFE